MHHESNETPSLVPLLALISGIAVSRWSNVDLALCVCAALLASILLKRHGALMIIGIALFITGAARSRAHERAVARVDALLDDTVVRLEAPLQGAWNDAGSGARLRLRGGTLHRLSGPDTPLQLDEPISIFAPTPTHLGDSERVSAVGVVRRSEFGTLRLQVKSALLIEHSGRARWFDPAAWNRRLSETMTARATTSRLVAAVRLARAIALGETASLDDDTRRVYREGGTYHLLVFSGMQLGLAAAFVGFLLRRFGRPRIVDAALIVIAIVAAPFAGFEPSVTRASVAIGAYAASRLLRRPTSLPNLLFLSALLRLMWSPEDLTDIGFQLTYAAAAGLTIVGSALERWMGMEKRGIRAILRGACAELMTLPLSLHHFHRTLIGGAVVTVILAPVVSLMLLLSLLLALAATTLPRLMEPLAGILLALNEAAVLTNQFVASLRPLTLFRIGLPLSILGATYVAMLLLTATRRQRYVPLLALALLIASVVAFDRPHSGLTVTALDVGQGDATLVRYDDATMLVDGGGSGDDTSFGERVVLPKLLERGVTRIDTMALSHAHPDHCGGLVSLIRTIPVGELRLPGRQWTDPCAVALVERARERDIPVVVNEHAADFNVGALHVRTLTPRLRFKRSALNNGSSVYRVDAERTSILLPGDLEKDGERMLAEEGGVIRSSILKVAHHGSRTSTTDALLDAVVPRIALISCGRNNRYGHPNEEVLQRLAERSVRVLRTDVHGDVSLHREYGITRVEREFDTPRSAH